MDEASGNNSTSDVDIPEDYNEYDDEYYEEEEEEDTENQGGNPEENPMD